MPGVSTILFVVLMGIGWQSAHAGILMHQILSGNAVLVRLQFAETAVQPVFEAYELYAPDSGVVFQKGFVNADGEVVFVPNRPGLWRLQLITEEGLGATIVIQAGSVPPPPGASEANPRFLQNVLLAFGTLLGFFGMLALAWSRARGGRRQ